MENTNQVETEETTHLQTAEAPPQAADPATEMVDFHLTPPVLSSLNNIVIWTKILVGCLVVIILAELILSFFAAYRISQYSQPLTFSTGILFFRSFASIAVNALLIYFGLKFVQNMKQALGFNNNKALETAFGHQNQYFKWVFINMLVTAVYTVLNGMFS